MKTPEEILNSLIIDDDYFDAIYKRDCLEAMEEYAQQKQGYPREFVEWIGFESPHRLYYQEITDKWFYATEFTNHRVYTLDELYEYWKLNIKDK